jgi:uncharacterized FAD-dependent dehydrogenase
MLESRDFVISPEIAYSPEQLHQFLLSELGANLLNNSQYRIEKISLDARNKNIKALVKIGLYSKDYNFASELESILPKLKKNSKRVIVIGSGPAGIFASIKLIELGFRPIILERGKNVRDRRRDIAAINRFNQVDSDSNYCFGEGGAGTYSDGKLYTRSKKRGDINYVLRKFVSYGADKNILYEAHPHIGTNKLPMIISCMRNAIIEAGGEFHFEHRVTDLLIRNNSIIGCQTNFKDTFLGEATLLATGHSARDIFTLFQRKNILIEAKSFAIGVRIEHLQSFIDKSQYKFKERPDYLPPASFSLVSKTIYKGIERGVFSFCMCPGGFIVPSATNQNQVAVNGMSPSRRDSKYANSGIVVSILPSDLSSYSNYGPLAGMQFQEELENRANFLSGGTQKAVSQLTSDFIKGSTSKEVLSTSYIPGLISGDIREILPDFITEPLKKGLQDFDRKIPGFSSNIGQLIGLESRTSSPVKIPRDPESLEHIEIRHLYPCGEGAGFAGGIMSAALDGINCAVAIAQKLN